MKTCMTIIMATVAIIAFNTSAVADAPLNNQADYETLFTIDREKNMNNRVFDRSGIQFIYVDFYIKEALTSQPTAEELLDVRQDAIANKVQELITAGTTGEDDIRNQVLEFMVEQAKGPAPAASQLVVLGPYTCETLPDFGKKLYGKTFHLQEGKWNVETRGNENIWTSVHFSPFNPYFEREVEWGEGYFADDRILSSIEGIIRKSLKDGVDNAPSCGPGCKTIVIKGGDTLGNLAAEHYGNFDLWKALNLWNYPDANPNDDRITAGTPLNIPPKAKLEAFAKERGL